MNAPIPMLRAVRDTRHVPALATTPTDLRRRDLEHAARFTYSYLCRASVTPVPDWHELTVNQQARVRIAVLFGGAASLDLGRLLKESV